MGCYAMAVPYMFYRRLGVADEDVKLRSSVGRLCAAGCDIAGVHTLSYGGGGAPAAVTRTAVRHSCACIGSPCLRRCVHGAPIGGDVHGGGALLLELHAAE
eukprot:COSAG01_NODE_9321_length_2484_cov_7.972327_3_plen_101_part_00